jgi:alkanesulfonate monooxygenase SsuD/methylene tetrahydromethanopterin reductase-like flavin-dependent oxidoreductase (luciferase family)
MLEQYAMHAEAAGHDPDQIPHIISAIAGTSVEGDDIKNLSWDHLVWWTDEGSNASGMYAPGAPLVRSYEWRVREYQERVIRGMRSAVDMLPQQFKHNPIGSPQECVDKLSATIEATGIKRFALGFEAAGERSAVLDSIELFASDVMPHFA